MYTLYTIPGSCSTGITVLLEKLGVEYTLIQRDEVENYASIVPTNQVPALVDGDQLITEGAAIVLYLLEKHQSAMLPKDLSEKAKFLKWLMFGYATVHPAYAKVMATSKNMEISPEQQKLMQKLADGVSSLWQILDNHLEGKTFIYGDTPTVIDYLATIYTSWVHFFPEVKITIGPNVQKLVARVTALPEFQAAYTKEKTDFRKAS